MSGVPWWRLTCTPGRTQRAGAAEGARGGPSLRKGAATVTLPPRATSGSQVAGAWAVWGTGGLLHGCEVENEVEVEAERPKAGAGSVGVPWIASCLLSRMRCASVCCAPPSAELGGVVVVSRRSSLIVGCLLAPCVAPSLRRPASTNAQHQSEGRRLVCIASDNGDRSCRQQRPADRSQSVVVVRCATQCLDVCQTRRPQPRHARGLVRSSWRRVRIRRGQQGHGRSGVRRGAAAVRDAAGDRPGECATGHRCCGRPPAAGESTLSNGNHRQRSNQWQPRVLCFSRELMTHYLS